MLVLALSVAGCMSGQSSVKTDDGKASSVFYWHDVTHKVSCWTAWSSSITCLPDSQVYLP